MDKQGKYRNFAEGVVARQDAITGEYLNAAAESSDYCQVEPELSAKQTFTRIQILFLTVVSAVCLWGLIQYWERTIMIGAIVFSGFYFVVILFRSLVLAQFDRQSETSSELLQPQYGSTYVVLAAIYKEGNQVEALIRSLDALKWPIGKKTVYLICEEEDHETLSQIYSLPLPEGFNLLIVPAGTPMTKPRALNYGLSRVSGDYLVIYDAEDRPHPNQLLEAENSFRRLPIHTACLQAPLAIDNHNETWLTKLFSVEYDTLFHGILPVLSDWHSPIPLGGTSNHFRLETLRAVGGWDSYNVTEDADLGIRLARKKLHCATLRLPTYEEAPATTSSWTKQRTRWIKGWMQTLLVHLRNPLKTANEMGWGAFFKFHMVLTSVVVSVLVHPFFLVAFVFQIGKYFSGIPLDPYDIAITGMSSFNLVAGYTTYGLLALAVQSAKPPTVNKVWILVLPIYWIFISIAGWRALVKLLIHPHEWEKTSHGSAKRNTPDLV